MKDLPSLIKKKKVNFLKNPKQTGVLWKDCKHLNVLLQASLPYKTWTDKKQY